MCVSVWAGQVMNAGAFLLVVLGLEYTMELCDSAGSVVCFVRLFVNAAVTMVRAP